MFLSVTFMFIACLSALADEASKAVTLTEAGTLSTLITDDEKNTITSLTVSGPINTTDVATMKSMVTSGALSVIDMSEATADSEGLIQGSVFAYCSKLTSISLPKNVTSIGDKAFYYCSNLTSVIIPDNVTHIYSDAFNGCSSLTSVVMGKSVTKIEQYAFWDCKNLKKVVVKDIAAWCGINFSDSYSNPLYYAKHLYDADGVEIKDLEIPNSVINISNRAFNGCTGLTSVTIGSGMTSIGDQAFYNCTGLTSVTIDSGMTSIGDHAFYNCSSLTFVTIPNSVTSIGDYAFYSCTSLTSITLPESLTIIDYGVFHGCSSLTSVTIPNSVKEIKGSAFCGCKKLTSVTIPNSVTSIDHSVFQECTGLTSVTIGNSVTSIGETAFRACSNLTEVTLQGSTLPNCGTNAFEYIDLSKATLYCAPGLDTSSAPWSSFGTIIPTVTLASGKSLSDYISDDVKYTITKLKIFGEINSEDITLMADMARSGALSVIDMSEATTTNTGLIRSNAFYECKKLTSISLPNGITSIGKNAFYNCSGLKSVTIPDGVTSIGNYAFLYCTSLTSVTIPNSVTSIGSSVFYGCTGLASVIIGNSVTSIGDNAFSYCSNLTSIEVEDGNTYYHVDGNCLIETASNTLIRGCGLTSITIPDGVTNIGEGAFCGCTKFTSITIPNSVTSIGDYAFADCTNLAEVSLQGTTLPTSCATTAFDGIPSDATLYCKAALLEKCKATEPWKNFNIVVKSFSVSISDAGIATGCFDDDLDFSGVTGVKAYIASGFNPETGKVLMTNVTEVPAGTGFLVKGTEDTYEIPAAATKYMYANLLVGTLEETTVSGAEGTYTNYVLVNDATDGVGFYLLANETVVPANKAYLQLPTSAVTTDETSEAKTSLRLSFDDMDDTTGITHVRELSDSASGKTVIYNLNGQRKQNLTKGLNIVNGKKIFVK